MDRDERVSAHQQRLLLMPQQADTQGPHVRRISRVATGGTQVRHVYEVIVRSDAELARCCYLVLATSVETAARKGMRAYRKEEPLLSGRPRVTAVNETGTPA